MNQPAARLQPIGFWSYATQDDMASGGRLSKLRSMLMNELQQQYGRNPIKIFQDVAAIPPGSEWDHEIGNALAQATFFIPIVTPAFIESEYCAQEVKVFLATERSIWQQHPALNGMRRIFPIYYRSIDAIEPFDPDVLSELRRVQWVNFLDLRNKSDQAEDVQNTLDRLATSICKLLLTRVDASAPAPSEPEARSPKMPGEASSDRQDTPVARAAIIEQRHEPRSNEPDRALDGRATDRAVSSTVATDSTPTLDPARLRLAFAAGGAAFLVMGWLLSILGLQGFPSSAAFLLYSMMGILTEAIAAIPLLSVSRRRDWTWFKPWKIYGLGFGVAALFSAAIATLGVFGGTGVVVTVLFGGMPGLVAAIAFQHFATRPAKPAR